MTSHDGMTSEQCALLDELTEQLKMGTEDDLTDWEQNFLEENLDRYDTYGERTRISEAQWKHLHRIAEKLRVE